MTINKVRFLVILLVICLLVSTPPAFAQDGVLASGQPLVAAVTPGAAFTASYTLTDARGVSITAISDSAPPTLSILLGDEVIASSVNPTNEIGLTLNAFLLAGTYTVRVSTVDGGGGNIALSIGVEVPIRVDILASGAVQSGQVTPELPVALYRMNALPEPGFLYIENALLDTGARIRIVNSATGAVTGGVGSDLLGARLLFAPGSAAYQIEVIQSGSPNPEPFSLCFTPTSADSCETTTAPAVSTPPPVEPTLAPTVITECTVAPNSAGGANIRQTADVNAPLVGAMPANTSASVIGISPDRSFYNVNFNGRIGWVAASVVTATGDCSSIQTINPPPTLTPTPTATFTPTPSATPTPAGPCVISFGAPTFVYTIPNADPSYLFDQAQPGQTYTANGRLSSGGWVRATRSDGVIQNAWIQTSQVLSNGSCNNLPVVSP
jgi:hypothetical protein